MSARVKIVVLLSILSMSISLASAQSQTTSPTNSPALQTHSRQPIPMAWKIAAIAVVAAAGVAVIAFALPRWRSGNLFDRQYRFPIPDQVSLRLGGTRSGGSMAAIDFNGASTAEDA